MARPALPDRDTDFAADPVELFFDLAYVFAFSQLVTTLIDEPTWQTVGRSSLLLVRLPNTFAQCLSATTMPGGTIGVGQTALRHSIDAFERERCSLIVDRLQAGADDLRIDQSILDENPNEVDVLRSSSDQLRDSEIVGVDTPAGRS